MLTSPRSSRSKTEATIVSPREFKNSVREFMRKGIELSASSHEEFIPYAQERDSLGNLLAKRGNLTFPLISKENNSILCESCF